MAVNPNFFKINLVWVGFAFALGCWLIEAALHAWYWHTGPISVTIFAQSQTGELEMRQVIVSIMVVFGFTVEQGKQYLLKLNRAQERTNRLLRFLSDCNQHVQRQMEEQALMEAACRSAVDIGRFRFAWIGMHQGNEFKLVAWAAANETLEGLVSELQESAALLQCLCCQNVLKEGVSELCELKTKADCPAPWRLTIMEQGCQHATVLPLQMNGKTVGVFEIYAGEEGQISIDEKAILDEVANDVSIALGNIALEAERKQKSEELASRVDELERFQHATIDREFRIKELRDEVAALKQENDALRSK